MTGRVPRLFWSDGFIAYNLKRVLIIADYDLIVKMFKDRVEHFAMLEDSFLL